MKFLRSRCSPPFHWHLERSNIATVHYYCTPRGCPESHDLRFASRDERFLKGCDRLILSATSSPANSAFLFTRCKTMSSGHMSGGSAKLFSLCLLSESNINRSKRVERGSTIHKVLSPPLKEVKKFVHLLLPPLTPV